MRISTSASFAGRQLDAPSGVTLMVVRLARSFSAFAVVKSFTYVDDRNCRANDAAADRTLRLSGVGLAGPAVRTAAAEAWIDCPGR